GDRSHGAAARTRFQHDPNTTVAARQSALARALRARADATGMTSYAVRSPRVATTRLRGLSIVLPCHDEAENIERAIAEATLAAERVADAHEVLVVDDGSADATRALALARAARDPRVRVLVHEENRGYGAVLRTGFAA